MIRNVDIGTVGIVTVGIESVLMKQDENKIEKYKTIPLGLKSFLFAVFSSFTINLRFIFIGKRTTKDVMQARI